MSAMERAAHREMGSEAELGEAEKKQFR